MQANYGFLAAEYGEVFLPLQVCKSGAGYYIGTLGEFGEPYSRESDCYWSTNAECAEALRTGNWPQKPHP